MCEMPQESATFPLFDKDSIDYLKAIGNVTFFIHGFNVPPGDYAFEIDKLHKDMLPPEFNTNDPLPNDIEIEWTDLKRTIFNSKKLVAQRFQVNEEILPVDLDDDVLNGTGACNWFVHMENNLNVATNQFKHIDYLKYNRIVGINWAGDVGILNYVASEDKADETAMMMQGMILQLHEHDIQINIIAHSMGNRLLVKLLDILGKSNLENIISHAFLWEAAIPDTALSNNVQLDKTRRKNCSFPYAHKAVDKITVLYSRNDDVLTLPYWLGTFLDKTPTELYKDWGHPERVQNYDLRSQVIIKQVMMLLMDETFRDFISLYIDEQVANWLGLTTATKSILTQNVFIISKELVERYDLRTALGYNGPDKNDPLIQELLSSGKLYLADMTEWGIGHSYMKIPSKDIMRYGYQKWIINKKYGIKDFGLYDSNQFCGN